MLPVIFVRERIGTVCCDIILKKRRNYHAYNCNAAFARQSVSVAAGQPIFAAENYEDYFSLPENFFSGENLFMLNVQGSSMIKIGMFDGDKVVVRKQESADNGDIVVALIDESATVKRFFKRDGKIILHPENDEMNDFIFNEVQILGKVVGLIRNL